jgi:hypothetical protein
MRRYVWTAAIVVAGILVSVVQSLLGGAWEDDDV